MNRMTWMLVGSAAAAAAWVAPALAQQDPEAKASLQESTQVLRNTESLTFKSRRYGTGMLKDILDSEGEVKVFRPKGQAAPMVRITGRVKQPGQAEKQLEAVSDGKILRWLDHTNNTLMIRPLTDTKAKQEMSFVDQILLPVLIQPEPYAVDLKQEKIQKLGIEQVMNDVCEIIFAGPVAGDGGSHWAISQVDRLPRQMKMVRGTPGNELAWITDMWDFNTDAGLATKDFEIALPVGYVIDEKLPAAAPTPPAAPVVELGVPVGSPAPQFSLTGADGKTVANADLKGHPVVLEFFGTMFTQSTAHAADMKALHEQFKPRNVKFVGLACRELDDDAPKDHFRTHGLAYTLVPKADAAIESYKVIGFPSYYVLDAQGNVAAFYQGWPGKDKLAEAITEAANK